MEMACTCVICNEYENKLVFYHLKTRHSTTVVKVLFNLLQFLSDAPIRDFADYPISQYFNSNNNLY